MKVRSLADDDRYADYDPDPGDQTRRCRLCSAGRHDECRSTCTCCNQPEENWP